MSKFLKNVPLNIKSNSKRKTNCCILAKFKPSVKMMCDWDDLELDNTHNHNSRMFFEKRRSKHERKNIVKVEKNEEDEFVQLVDELFLCDKQLPLNESVTKNENPFDEQVEQEQENKENEQKIINVAVAETAKNELSKPKRKLNLVTPSRFAKPNKNSAVPATKQQPQATAKVGGGAIPKPPSERLIAIPRKREELLRKKIEEEKKLREFHSRPMPKFKIPLPSKTYHKITAAETPIVAKRSKESRLKQLKKVKEIEENSKPAPFKAQTANVVYEMPFVPKKPTTTTTSVIKPYNLRSENRLMERKRFDEAMQRAFDEKKKREEEEQKRLEEERCKELRKATVFKANPNPFK